MSPRISLVKWLVARGRQLWHMHQWQASEQCWRQVLCYAEPGTAAWRWAQARLAALAERRQDYAQARQHVRALLRVQQKQARWYYHLGRLYYKECDRSLQRRALRALRRAVRLEPEKARYWSVLGRCLADLGHPRAALRCLYRAWQLQPRSQRYLLELLELLLASDRFAEAQRVAEQARFIWRSQPTWESVRQHLRFLRALQQQRSAQQLPIESMLLPFPGARADAGDTGSPSRTATALPTTSDNSGSDTIEPVILRLDPAHALSQRCLGFRGRS
ncbi:MAG: hypothetical protein NZ914_03105 [Gemmatales bacterium]|nr:hypothetical protein [Gemmatales bacterium]